MYRCTALSFAAILALSGCASHSTAPVTTPAPAASPTATVAAAEPTPTPTPEPVVIVDDDPAVQELKEHHRHHHHGGLTHFIAMSLDTLGTDDAKRPQIEKIQHSLHVCTAPSRKVEKRLLETLAAGIDAGTIDTTKVDHEIGRLKKDADAASTCSNDALNQLHALLSPSERQALVDKVQSHWHIWQKVNHETDAGVKEKGSRLDALTTELSLTPDQVDKMSGALTTAMDAKTNQFDPSKVEAHLQAFLTAFAGDAFEAASIKANANGHMATHGAKRMALFYETILPILTPAQRKDLAAHLRDHAGQQPPASAAGK